MAAISSAMAFMTFWSSLICLVSAVRDMVFVPDGPSLKVTPAESIGSPLPIVPEKLIVVSSFG